MSSGSIHVKKSLLSIILRLFAVCRERLVPRLQ